MNRNLVSNYSCFVCSCSTIIARKGTHFFANHQKKTHKKCNFKLFYAKKDEYKVLLPTHKFLRDLDILILYASTSDEETDHIDLSSSPNKSGRRSRVWRSDSS